MSFATKEKALDYFEAVRKEYLAEARAVAVKLLEKQLHVTVDDVRKLCPPPKDCDPRVMGAIFNTKDFEPYDYINSTRSTCHKRPIRRFQKANR